MLAWMLYALTVSLLLTCAAAAASRAAHRRHAPSRVPWAAALALSVLIPALVPSVSFTLPALAPGAAPPPTLALRDLAPPILSPSSLLAAIPAPAAGAAIDAALVRIWAALSLLLTLALLAAAALLARRRRAWPAALLAGTEVLVSEDTGPALAGLIAPSIVVPVWLRHAPPETQRHVIAHERAHLAAGDTLLLAAALLPVIVLPWNLPLWWQLRQLRRAIEIDCDRRVLATGIAPARYAETLIALGARRGRRRAALAMAEPVTDIERRIRLMLQPRRTAALLPLIGAGFLAAAAGVAPPNAGPASDLARFTGPYRMTPDLILTVTQQNGALLVQLTGQPALRVTPHGPAAFTADTVGAEFDFALPPDGPAQSVTLHQKGQTVVMPRIDAAEARQAAAAPPRTTPVPGSRAALERFIGNLLDGSPDDTTMTPQLAEVVHAQFAHLHDISAALGAVQSITFLRVGGSGEDVYRVVQRSGTTIWRIVLFGHKIAGIWETPDA